MKISVKDWIGHLPFFLLLIVTAVINQFVEMRGDDIRYATYFGLFPSFQGQEVTLTNIIRTQIYDYFHVNGRFIVNVFCVLVLVQGIVLWRILNPLFLVLLAYAMFYAVFVRFPRRDDVWRTALIAGCIYLAHPEVIHTTINYATGSFNYLYPMALLMVFIGFFRRYDINKPIQNKFLLFLFVLLGFVLGWSQEQVSLLAIGFVLLWLIKSWVKKHKISMIHIMVFFSTLIGCLFLFLSPGSKLRLQLPELAYYNSLSFMDRVLHSLPGVMRFFIMQETVCTVLIIVLLSVLCYRKSGRSIWLLMIPLLLIPFIFATKAFGVNLFNYILGKYLPSSIYGLTLMIVILIMGLYLKDRDYMFYLFSLGFLAATVVMIFTPSHAGGRVAFPSIVLGICLILLLLERMDNRKLNKHIVSFLIICSSINYASILKGWID